MDLEEQTARAMAQTTDVVVSDIQSVFQHPRAGTLLAWLMDTCCATETTIDENPIIMAAAEGRRQVWVALNKILSLSAKDIAEIRRNLIAAREDEND